MIGENINNNKMNLQNAMRLWCSGRS